MTHKKDNKHCQVLNSKIICTYLKHYPECLTSPSHYFYFPYCLGNQIAFLKQVMQHHTKELVSLLRGKINFPSRSSHTLFSKSGFNALQESHRLIYQTAHTAQKKQLWESYTWEWLLTFFSTYFLIRPKETLKRKPSCPIIPMPLDFPLLSIQTISGSMSLFATTNWP